MFRVLLTAAATLSAEAMAVANAGSVQQVQAFRHDGWLQMNLVARSLLDKRTASTVESGLPGTCMYRIKLEDRSGETIGQRLLQLSLRLDLWESRYVLLGPAGKTLHATLAAADSAWAQLRDVRVLPLERLKPDGEYRFQVQVAVRPLGSEEQARISRYVSEQSGGDREEFALDVGALLDRFIGRGRRPEQQSSYTGPFFRLRDLRESP